MKYFPCIEDPKTGHINIKVGEAMSKDEATDFLIGQTIYVDFQSGMGKDRGVKVTRLKDVE